MTLCMVLQNSHGFAIGADSLVSHTSGQINPDEFLSAMREIGERDTYTRNEIFGFLKRGLEEIVTRVHRSSKIFANYRVNGHHFGACVCAGNGTIANKVSSITEEIDRMDQTRSFEDYLSEVLQRLQEYFDTSGSPVSGAEMIFLGFCHVRKKYCVKEIQIKQQRKNGENSFSASIITNDMDGRFLMHIGDGRIVDTLLLGSSGEVDRAIAQQMKIVIVILLEMLGISEEKVMERAHIAQILTEGIRASAHPYNVPESIEKVLNTMASHQESTICLEECTNFLALAVTKTLVRRFTKGKSIQHFQLMTLRELLKVIQFLIETTARVHEYVHDDIPTVGGDLYFATLTSSEGLVFRNLQDPF